jgi:hypothetical protein
VVGTVVVVDDVDVLVDCVDEVDVELVEVEVVCVDDVDVVVLGGDPVGDRDGGGARRADVVVRAVLQRQDDRLRALGRRVDVRRDRARRRRDAGRERDVRGDEVVVAVVHGRTADRVRDGQLEGEVADAGERERAGRGADLRCGVVGGLDGDDRRRLVADRHGVARSGADIVVGAVLQRQDDGLGSLDEGVVVRRDRASGRRLAGGERDVRGDEVVVAVVHGRCRRSCT